MKRQKMEYKITEKLINEGATQSSDPRVDKAVVRVVTQSPVEDRKVEPIQILEKPTEASPSENPVETEQHVCSVGVQKAIEQNWKYFLIIALAILGLGYLFGKSKTS